MNREAKRVLLHLVIGASITLVTTVAFSLWSNVYGTGVATPVDPLGRDIVWPDYVKDVWPKPTWAVENEKFGFGVRQFEAMAYEHPSDRLKQYDEGPLRGGVNITSFGWPFRTADTIMVVWNGGTREQRRATMKHFQDILGWRVGVIYPSWIPGCDDPLRPRFVPIDVRPLGFSANTAFYGGISLCIGVALREMRAWRRRRAGRCVGCGYSVVGLQRCPECGMPCAKSRTAAEVTPRSSSPD